MEKNKDPDIYPGTQIIFSYDSKYAQREKDTFSTNDVENTDSYTQNVDTPWDTFFNMESTQLKCTKM